MGETTGQGDRRRNNFRERGTVMDERRLGRSMWKRQTSMLILEIRDWWTGTRWLLEVSNRWNKSEHDQIRPPFDKR